MNIKHFVAFCALCILCTLRASASEYYGFNIGGVPVTSDNWTNITGKHIEQNVKGESWFVYYEPDWKTVVLKNVKITRTGNDARAIYNQSCEGLTIYLIGDNILSSESAAPVRLQKNTTIEMESGTTTIIGGSEDGIYITNQSTVNVIGEGSLVVQATSSSAIEGSDSSNRPTVNFMGPNVTLEGKGGDLVDVIAKFNNSYSDSEGTVNPRSTVTLKATGDYSKPNVRNSSVSLYGTPATLILEPWDATISSGSIFFNNVKIYGRDIVIGNSYVALITGDYFPDSNFREQLLAKFPKHYISDDDVSQCTSLDLSGKGILSLTGIGYFTALKTLKCPLNYGLSALDLSANLQLTTLNCSSCALPSLTLGNNKNLKTLDCSGNKLSSLNISGCTALTNLDCSENKLSSLNLGAKENLTKLDCSDNQLPTLNVSNCKALTEITCSYNQFTTLSITGMPVLKQLNCSFNYNLKTINSYENPKLSTLLMSNLQALETLDCHGCALTSISIPSTSSFRQLTCHMNNISGTSTDNLMSQLYDRTGMTNGQLILKANASGEHNTCTEQQALTALGKNWDVLYDNGSPLYDFTPTVVQSVAVPQQQTLTLYNLNGQPVNSGYKGIVIKNGKKVRQ